MSTSRVTDAERPGPTFTAGPGRTLLVSSALALIAGAGPALLLRLAQFGQQPPDRLQVPVVLLFGALFVGLLVELTTALEPRRRDAVLVAATAVGASLPAALALFGSWDPRYLLSPLVAGGAALLLSRLDAKRAQMFGAMLVFTACTLLANYTLDSFLPLGDFFLLNVGTLFFGITFTQRDRVHRFGRRAVYAMIFSAAVVNVLLAASVGTPLRYIAVSFLVLIIAETADTEIYQRLLGKSWLTRVASSNAVSAPLDTILFTTLAFWGEDFATRGWMTQVIVTDVLVKYASGILAALGMMAVLRAAVRPLVAGREA
ncbi:MAG: VUT family protein [Trueperaceae bacterium]|nr:VUT family protein [Trueperaceae bacterium]